MFRKTVYVLVGLLLCLASGEASAGIIYVANGTGGFATTWPGAYTTIQSAIDTATAGDQIWVARGTYQENISLTDGVALYGGFKGDEVSLATRDLNANPTRIDGL